MVNLLKVREPFLNDKTSLERKITACEAEEKTLELQLEKIREEKIK